MTPPPKRPGRCVGPRGFTGEVLDVAAAASLLGTTEKTIRARVARRTIPFRRWGGRVVFLRRELLAFLQGLEGVDVREALASEQARLD